MDSNKPQSQMSPEALRGAIGSLGTLGLLASGDKGLSVRRDLFFPALSLGRQADRKAQSDITDRGHPQNDSNVSGTDHSVRANQQQSPLLVIGWDAADWNMIHPLVNTGKMPALAKLMQKGMWGNLASIYPMLSPMLWTTIATGHYGDKHNILGFVEPTEDGTSVRPASSTSRKCKAIWNILTQNNIKSNVVNWFASHPAEPILGNFVANSYHPAGRRTAPFATSPKHAVHPVSLNEQLERLRVDTRELMPSDLEPFIPNAMERVQSGDQLIATFAKHLAQAASIQAIATKVFRDSPAPFNAVYFQTIDLVGHEFMQFHPPKPDGVDAELFRHYQSVMDGVYCFHDMMLQSMLDQMPEDTTVIIVSDHGFHHGGNRPQQEENWRDNALDWHRRLGMALISGPETRSDERLWGATLMDIAPTILYAMGLPVGEDMPGRPLRQAFETSKEAEYIPSWEEVGGECGMHDKPQNEESTDPWQASEMLKHLAALGYVEYHEDEVKRIEAAKEARLQVLTQVLFTTDRQAEALPIIEDQLNVLPTDSPKFPQLYSLKVRALAAAGQLEAAEDLISNSPPTVTQVECRRLLAEMFMRRAKPGDAVQVLLEITKDFPNSAHDLYSLAMAHIRAGEFSQAEPAIDKALELNCEFAEAMRVRGYLLLKRKQYDAASKVLLRSIELNHFQPNAHMFLGVAWAHLSYPIGAMHALEAALKLDPNLRPALRLLAKVHKTLEEQGYPFSEPQSSIRKHLGRYSK